MSSAIPSEIIRLMTFILLTTVRKLISHGLTVDFGSCRTSMFIVVQQFVGDAPKFARVAGCRIYPVGDVMTA